MKLYTTEFLYDCYTECGMLREDWLNYALELEQAGMIEDAAYALEQAILYDQDADHWNQRLQIPSVVYTTKFALAA